MVVSFSEVRLAGRGLGSSKWLFLGGGQIWVFCLLTTVFYGDLFCVVFCLAGEALAAYDTASAAISVDGLALNINPFTIIKAFFDCIIIHFSVPETCSVLKSNCMCLES